MPTFQSMDDVNHYVADGRKRRWSRNAIHEELVEGGLSPDEATGVLDGEPVELVFDPDEFAFDPAELVFEPDERPTGPPPLPSSPGRSSAQHSSTQPPSKRPASTRGPAGLGGWLILPLIFLALGPVQQGLDRVALLKEATSPALAAAELKAPGLTQFVRSHAVAVGVFLVGLLLALTLFLRKKRAAPKVIIGLLLYHVFLLIGQQVWLGSLAVPESAGPHAVRLIPGVTVTGVNPAVIAVLVAMVWIPYFLVSERVKNTFVR